MSSKQDNIMPSAEFANTSVGQMAAPVSTCDCGGDERGCRCPAGKCACGAHNQSCKCCEQNPPEKK
ncbi:hypothetical protein SAICODRAFT_7023 [Saitoella complicata NRRL Y-17804]|uniref:uncharacterized protein n=1 Tax=Saitoella complicata (strain BCRC 22490 / CBS 7301 / JCM 7358 / NBRC 10748 / NRRL Y-17804) TaxID=698492 RepID=UPI0008670536|nr:uncharacterized protein SAICODRAFT_7023 [Saitoella complicata NRRL Y-17804]ODQ53779.1 hypothetical protein SAICODRAFT_7023 [Saitoella complicata NRRL Y-17804]